MDSEAATGIRARQYCVGKSFYPGPTMRLNSQGSEETKFGVPPAAIKLVIEHRVRFLSLR